MKDIDARGLSCPEPVILTKAEADKGETALRVYVDTEVAKENVTRFLKNSGYKLIIKESMEETIIEANK